MSEDYLNLFNNKLLEFLEELKTSFPDKHEFSFCYNLVNGTLLIDKFIANKIFNKNIVIPYGTYITNKNEDFLLAKDYSNDLQNVDVDTSFIDGLKRIWIGLDEQNKEMIWTYIRLLYLLNNRVQEY